MLRRHRIKIKKTQTLVLSYSQSRNQLTTTVLNTPFYQYGVDKYENISENGDILIFFSDNGITRLYSEDFLCANDKFSLFPHYIINTMVK